MTEFKINVTHACGHTERHTGGTASGDTTSLATYLAKHKCSTCRPRCEYCHRVGDRENMLIVEVNAYSSEEQVAAAKKAGYVFCNLWCYEQAQHPTHYSEHNEIAIPGFLRDWEDHSYHNDLCGRSAIEIGKHFITIWVNFEQIEDREDPSCTRFVVEFCPMGDNRGDDGDVLYSGDDAAVAAQWASAAEDVASGAPPDDDIAAMVARIHKLIAEYKQEND